MKFFHRNIKLIAVALSCVGIGAAISAIASAGAATTLSTQSTATSAQPAAKAAHRRHGGQLWLGVARSSVAGSVVVATKQGFTTVTFERGIVRQVNGQQLTLAEGTAAKTYRVVTLTIPGNAKVRDDRQTATLASLKPGQRVVVVTGPRATRVIARTAR